MNEADDPVAVVAEKEIEEEKECQEEQNNKEEAIEELAEARA